jgi:hypothetical protein
MKEKNWFLVNRNLSSFGVFFLLLKIRETNKQFNHPRCARANKYADIVLMDIYKLEVLGNTRANTQKA